MVVVQVLYAPAVRANFACANIFDSILNYIELPPNTLKETKYLELKIRPNTIPDGKICDYLVVPSRPSFLGKGYG